MKKLVAILIFAASLAQAQTPQLPYQMFRDWQAVAGSRAVASAVSNPLPDNLWTSCVMLLEFPSEATTTNFTDSSPAPTYNGYSTNANTAPAWTATNDGGYVTFDGVNDLLFCQSNKIATSCIDHFSVYAFLRSINANASEVVLFAGGGTAYWYFSKLAANDGIPARRQHMGINSEPTTAGQASGVIGASVVAVNTWFGTGLSGDGTTWEIYLNGVRDVPYTTNVNNGRIGDWWDTINPPGLTISTGGGYMYNGSPYPRTAQEGFLAVFDRVLSPNEFLQLHNLWKARFGL